MNICVIGTGYVGLVTGTCFAEMGNNVWCIDIDENKIAMLNNGKIPIHETGLEAMVKRNLDEGRLWFTSDLVEAKPSLFVFIAVGTPPGEDGTADLTHVIEAAEQVGCFMEGYKIIIIKSTVPAGTALMVRKTIQAQLVKRGLGHLEFDVVSNPEFLKEGVAIEDFMRPDRIIIGTDNVRTAELMKELYSSFTRNGHPLLIMDIPSAELTKYASNAMLATRISFMNEMAALCDAIGADIEQIRRGIGSDDRIGMSFLYAGLGYGGSCFPKDIKALIRTAREYNTNVYILNAVEEVNSRQNIKLLDQILKHFGEDLYGLIFAVWGLAFKPQTDDMREAPSVNIILGLKDRGAIIHAYDPVAISNARNIMGEINIVYFDDAYKALEGADALLLVTEWRQFRNVDFQKIKLLLKKPLIFDGRNQYEPQKMREIGFTYFCIGRNCV